MPTDFNRSRKSEAQHSGAAWPAPQHSNCDLALDHKTVDQWEISIRSERADAWVRTELSQPFDHCLGGRITVDVLSADRFIKSARAQGFRIEFVGPGGKDLL
ncbi:hypothetical protein [Rhizobium leguminosarum]|uniref:hypothetical protein n=1 Tax=Rhizobium leguminosarum TaxID=384 RepID=UPI003F98E840